MLSQKELKKALEQWKQHCSEIQSITTAGNASESKTEQLRRIQRARKDYAYFVEYYFPHYCTDKDTGKLIPSAKFHIKAANEILNNKQVLLLTKSGAKLQKKIQLCNTLAQKYQLLGIAHVRKKQ